MQNLQDTIKENLPYLALPSFFPFLCWTSTPHCLNLLFYPVKPSLFRIFPEVATCHTLPLVLTVQTVFLTVKVVKELIRVPVTKFLLLNCICFPILQIFPNNFQTKQPSRSLLFNRALFFRVKQLLRGKKIQTNLRPHMIHHPKIHFLLKECYKLRDGKMGFAQEESPTTFVLILQLDIWTKAEENVTENTPRCFLPWKEHSACSVVLSTGILPLWFFSAESLIPNMSKMVLFNQQNPFLHIITLYLLQ